MLNDDQIKFLKDTGQFPGILAVVSDLIQVETNLFTFKDEGSPKALVLVNYEVNPRISATGYVWFSPAAGGRMIGTVVNQNDRFLTDYAWGQLNCKAEAYLKDPPLMDHGSWTIKGYR